VQPPYPLAAPARDSLEGLALGDAFGERWFRLFRSPEQAVAEIRDRITPQESPWHWTDDTAMALALVRVLVFQDAVHQEDLARSFGATFLADPARGYGRGMRGLLPVLAERPGAWRAESRNLFRGEGSLGNGAAMRVAPLGAWFAGDLDEAVAQAAFSAEVTHAHEEAVAGAVAVAAAAALAAASRGSAAPTPAELLARVVALTPTGVVREGLRRAAELAPGVPAWQAADVLGSGQGLHSSDTVPFALWSAARHLDDLPGALWTTAAGLGDVDTTCAITGGVVAARTGLGDVPQEWLTRREPLPDWVDAATASAS
jgi:ADP-ribosylglycohydrolase